MPKDEKSKFDPQKFLDDYEDNLSPSVGSKKEQQSATSKVNPPDETTTDANMSASEEKTVGAKRGNRRRNKPAVISTLNDKEADYVENFLVDSVDVGFGRSGKQVPIDVEYHSLITILRALHGNNVTIGGIINNMLKEHFDLHEAEITGLLNKNTKLNNR